jgi:hypothetical protein
MNLEVENTLAGMQSHERQGTRDQHGKKEHSTRTTARSIERQIVATLHAVQTL